MPNLWHEPATMVVLSSSNPSIDRPTPNRMQAYPVCVRNHTGQVCTAHGPAWLVALSAVP